MSLDQSLNRVVQRYDELTAQLSADSQDPKKFVQLSKEYSDLSPIVERVRELQDVRSEIADLEAMVDDTQTDPDMKALARDELVVLREREPELEKQMRLLLLPKDEADEKNAILEIRAGTGGDEAALFATALFRMYQRYAETHGWKVNVLSASENEIGGYKEIIAEVTGRDVFSRLKFESGVHRVQRVPETESSGRIHTSAATVAVLPEAEDVDVVIEDKDLRIDTYRASGAGGQHVNKTDSAIRITHLPSGIVVTQQDEKSQHKNRARAMQVLRARLYDHERQQRDAERAADRKGQVGSGDRSQRIRTYNFPQGRVSDHRINLTLHKLDSIMAGDSLDEVIEPLIAEDQAARLADQT